LWIGLSVGGVYQVDAGEPLVLVVFLVVHPVGGISSVIESLGLLR
jgi:hypothetical protein